MEQPASPPPDSVPPAAPEAGNPSSRPAPPERTDSSLPPHERESITKVPVTPGISLGTYDSRPTTSDVPGGQDDSPSYFRPSQRELVSSPEPAEAVAQSPKEAAIGAKSGYDILRRMSLVNMGGRRESLTEFRSVNPDLSLSGNIISATFNIPHSLEYRQGADWILQPRRGQSALFDSFSFLSSDEAPWNHTVVAWTGEIDAPPAVPSPPATPPVTTTHVPPLNQLSAPIPVDVEDSSPQQPTADGLWISHEDQLRLENQLSHDRRIKTVPVWLSDDSEASEEGIRLTDQSRWRRYAEHELYGQFHYKQHGPTDGRKERVQWADYYRMNQKFANKITEIYKPGDIVVVHDYYLMLLPSMLRQRSPHMYISFFLHSPFPSSEFFRCLPRRKEVLEGLMGSNLIGFQSYSFARHFASCCTRLLGFPSDYKGVDAYGSRVEVEVFPIGIDAAKAEKLAWSDAVTAKHVALKEMYGDKKIIVGRDRLDSVRGVDKKLLAFQKFLERYPEWREKVVLIQVTSPTSMGEDGSDEDAKIANRVNELVMSINGVFGSLGFSPVQHYPQYLSQEEYFALLRTGDIGLITSIRDGMNTTALEYIICQRDNHGPLIISEFSGTAGTLRGAIPINPWDYNAVADEINRALTESAEERQKTQQDLYNHVTTKNVQHWISNFLRRLVHVLASRKNVVATPLLDRSDMLRRYRDARKRLFMFDYDGTLTPIVTDPNAALPSKAVITALKSLAADHRNAVWIISGRDQEFLSQHLSHISELGFSAEHGSFMRHPGQSDWENLAETFDMSWQDEVLAVFQKYTDSVPGSFIERKRCALTWHYRKADPEQGIQASRECQKELEHEVATKFDVDVMTGKANLEVRPTFINKGEISKRLVAEYNNGAIGGGKDKGPEEGGKVEFVLCMGDDSTDEDMFRALSTVSAPDSAEVKAEHVFTVTVGASTKVTLAKWHLLEPEDVIDCVALLADTTGAGGGVIGGVNLTALSAVEGQIPEGV